MRPVHFLILIFNDSIVFMSCSIEVAAGYFDCICVFLFQIVKNWQVIYTLTNLLFSLVPKS